MKKNYASPLALALSLFGASLLTACPDDGFEEAGETVDDAVDEAGDAIEDGADEVEDAADDVTPDNP